MAPFVVLRHCAATNSPENNRVKNVNCNSLNDSSAA